MHEKIEKYNSGVIRCYRGRDVFLRRIKNSGVIQVLSGVIWRCLRGIKNIGH